MMLPALKAMLKASDWSVPQCSIIAVMRALKAALRSAPRALPSRDCSRTQAGLCTHPPQS
eukprot:5159730-Amphidinium_carterae.1